jgi:hypothetical protein
MKLCSACGQPLPERRLGIKLTPIKAHIFDLVKAAGNTHITCERINNLVFDGRSRYEVIKSHIWQINDLIEDTGWKIVGERGYGYRLEQRMENGK